MSGKLFLFVIKTFFPAFYVISLLLQNIYFNFECKKWFLIYEKREEQTEIMVLIEKLFQKIFITETSSHFYFSFFSIINESIKFFVVVIL